MTIETFKSGLIKYYGKHENPHVESVTIAYVNSHYEKCNLENLLQSIMKSHPVKWGFPDVSAIEDSQDDLYKRENKTYKKVILSSGSWNSDIKPLTEQERIDAEKYRLKWNELLTTATEIKTDISITPEKMEQAKIELEQMR